MERGTGTESLLLREPEPTAKTRRHIFFLLLSRLLKSLTFTLLAVTGGKQIDHRMRWELRRPPARPPPPHRNILTITAQMKCKLFFFFISDALNPWLRNLQTLQNDVVPSAFFPELNHARFPVVFSPNYH